MVAVSSEPSRGDARSVDVARVRAALLESARWWSAKARSEAGAIDRLWVALECRGCGELFDRIFVCPEEPDPPLHRTADEVEAALDELFAGRSPLIDEPTWREATSCECGSPRHLASTQGAGLFHAMLGSGAGLVVARIGGRTEWYRLADGSGVPEAIEGSSIRASFGRPLSLFEALAELLPQIPPKPSTVVGTAAEPGAWFFAAESAAVLELGVDAKLGGRPRILVPLEPAMVRSLLWPASLRELARSIEEGIVVALAVETEALLAQARLWARARLDGDVRVREGGGWAFASERGHWPIEARSIALSMARTGRTSAEVVASALAEASRALTDRIATLHALAEEVPGSSFEVEGEVATARGPDGRAVRTIRLSELPAGAKGLPPEMLAREAAFLFDTAPPWASRARVCPCGAALSIESRLVPWPWPDPSSRPKLVRTWADERGGAAEVVALCCDRHVRIPSVEELEALGLDEARLEARLDADLAETRPRVHASIWRGPGEERAALVRGPFAASFVLSDARAVALHEAVGRPIEGPSLTGWAIGTDVALFVPEDADDGIVVRVLSALGAPSFEPFWLRREIDLSVGGVGTFEVVMGPRIGAG